MVCYAARRQKGKTVNLVLVKASDLAQAWRRSAPINGQSTPPFSYHTRGRVIDGAEGEDVVAELGETGHRLRHTAPSEDKVAQVCMSL